MEVVDELGEVLDGVDVVVRRRGDQGHSGLAAPQVGDVGAHLLGRQLPTLTCAPKALKCQLPTSLFSLRIWAARLHHRHT